jgi:hypothetical protein
MDRSLEGETHAAQDCAVEETADPRERLLTPGLVWQGDRLENRRSRTHHASSGALAIIPSVCAATFATCTTGAL